MDKRQLKPRSVILCCGMLFAVAAAFLSPVGNGGRGVLPETEAVTEQLVLETEEVHVMSEEEEKGLKSLYEMMENGELAEAADFMEQNKAMLDDLLHITFEDKRYLLTEDGVTDIIEGRGLVLTTASTAFYGNFAGGAPEGAVTAIQSIVLEKPRYDYSVGNWTAGKMNGLGTTGYIYYGETGEEDGLKTEKSGTFIDDLLEGEVRYISIDNSGNSVTWILQSEKGLTEIDDRWEHNATEKEYFLLSENDKSYAYIMKEEDLENEIWRNRIIW